jgi:hypothetical protein
LNHFLVAGLTAYQNRGYLPAKKEGLS